jgi:hypothetical protein
MKTETTDITENSIFLKEKIRYLNFLATYPDIKIKIFEEGSDVRFRAELTLPNGEIIVEEREINEHLLKNQELVSVMQDDMLKNIGFNYLKRSYEERKQGNVKIDIGHVYWSIKDIIKGK